jgi:hypothetical protein
MKLRNRQYAGIAFLLACFCLVFSIFGGIYVNIFLFAKNIVYLNPSLYLLIATMLLNGIAIYVFLKAKMHVLWRVLGVLFMMVVGNSLIFYSLGAIFL